MHVLPHGTGEEVGEVFPADPQVPGDIQQRESVLPVMAVEVTGPKPRAGQFSRAQVGPS